MDITPGVQPRVMRWGVLAAAGRGSAPQRMNNDTAVMLRPCWEAARQQSLPSPSCFLLPCQHTVSSQGKRSSYDGSILMIECGHMIAKIVRARNSGLTAAVAQALPRSRLKVALVGFACERSIRRRVTR